MNCVNITIIIFNTTRVFFFVCENKIPYFVLAFCHRKRKKTQKVRNMLSLKYFYGNCKKNKNTSGNSKKSKTSECVSDEIFFF